jgi:hypothetical protein
MTILYTSLKRTPHVHEKPPHNNNARHRRCGGIIGSASIGGTETGNLTIWGLKTTISPTPKWTT